MQTMIIVTAVAVAFMLAAVLIAVMLSPRREPKIDLSDIPEADEEWFKRAQLKKPKNPYGGGDPAETDGT